MNRHVSCIEGHWAVHKASNQAAGEMSGGQKSSVNCSVRKHMKIRKHLHLQFEKRHAQHLGNKVQMHTTQIYNLCLFAFVLLNRNALIFLVHGAGYLAVLNKQSLTLLQLHITCRDMWINAKVVFLKPYN